MSSQGASPRHSPKSLAEEVAEEPVPAPAAEPEPAPAIEVTSEAEDVYEPVEVTKVEAAPEIVVPQEPSVEEAVVDAIENAPAVEVPSIATEEVDAVEVCLRVSDKSAHTHPFMMSSRRKRQSPLLGFRRIRPVPKGPAPSRRLSRRRQTLMSRRSKRFPSLRSRLRFLASHPRCLCRS